MAEFLLEIGLEEIPARMIAAAEAELGNRVMDLLARGRLLDEQAALTTFSTPRRLAVRVEGVRPAQQDTEEQMTGPSWKVAYKPGPNGDEPTPSAVAFAKKAGVELRELTKVTNARGEYVSATVKRVGRAAAELLAAELPWEALSLYWAKNMYWRAGKPERFVRPVRWVVALLDAEIVPIKIAGIAAGNLSRGHRVLHGESPIAIHTPQSYASALQAGFVQVDVAARRHAIRKALDAATRAVAGARWREDEELIETVVHLTEWPTVILGDFEREYLALPEEVLVTVMRDHQKYFAVEAADGKLAPHYLAVLNTQVDEQGRDLIRHGNSRVLRARFKDARFFWEFDQKTSLEDRLASLKSVTFQKELGSYFWKTEANLRLAELLYRRLAARQAEQDTLPDRQALSQAVRLAKTDLTAELVKEFTELQGIIGGLYARAQGLDGKVADAIYWQYRPANTDDAIPPTREGQLLGLVDRVHTIVAMFSINLAPTGSKDPFALRRAANAVVKILALSGLPFLLSDLYGDAIEEVKSPAQAKLEIQIRAFFTERLSFYMKEVSGFAYDVVTAVLAAGADNVPDAIARAEALTAARRAETSSELGQGAGSGQRAGDFAAISAAFKRIKNILRQAAEKGERIPDRAPAANELVAAEELRLLAAASELEPRVAELKASGNYLAALERIATLRPTVDAFFETVMVMAPEPELRQARLALIQWVLAGVSSIADFGEMVG